MQALNRLLVTCGASIDEMNAVRKHLSALKGGRLAAAAPAAMKITLAITDVPDGRESALASGPTLPDPTTVFDACTVVELYGLLAKLPASIRARFEDPKPFPKHPSRAIPHSAVPFFSFCSDAMIYFIPHITPPKPPDLLRSATTPQTIGRSSARQNSCSRSFLS